MITTHYYFATSSHETLHFVESTIDVQEGMPIDVMFHVYLNAMWNLYVETNFQCNKHNY